MTAKFIEMSTSEFWSKKSWHTSCDKLPMVCATVYLTDLCLAGFEMRYREQARVFLVVYLSESLTCPMHSWSAKAFD